MRGKELTEALRASVEIDGRTVRTSYWIKPVPTNAFDWEAALDGYEPGDTVGYGPTEQAAIEDLREQIEERAS